MKSIWIDIGGAEVRVPVRMKVTYVLSNGKGGVGEGKK